MILVYALAAPAATRLRATGISGERLRLVAAGRIAAVVGEVRRVPPAGPTEARRYDAVIRALEGQLPALLPARFGTSFRDPDELAFVLRSRGASFVSALRQVRGRVQMNVRVVQAGSAAAIGGSAGADPAHTTNLAGEGQVRDRGPGIQYLQHKAAAAARIEGFDPVRTAVRRWVREERVEKRDRVASVYHLVPRGSVSAYRRALERSAADAGLRIVVTGPHPPYAFADPF